MLGSGTVDVFTVIKCYYALEKWETAKILIQIKKAVKEKRAGRLRKEEWGPRLSANRKKVLKTLWVRNWEGKTIRCRCGLITVKRSGHRIITAGPHMRGAEMKAREKEARGSEYSKTAKRKTPEKRKSRGKQDYGWKKTLHFHLVMSRWGQAITS